MSRSSFHSLFKFKISGAPKLIRPTHVFLAIGIISLISTGILLHQFAYNDTPWFFNFKPSPFNKVNIDDESLLSAPLTFEDIRSYERNLPQHNLSLPFPEGKNGRFVRFSNEIWALGLNNQLHNRLLLSHLAFLSNRAYVFNDITFDHNWGASEWNPLNTFISGPTAGGSFPPLLASARIPRAVHVSFYQTVCSEEVVDSDDKSSQKQRFAKLQSQEVNAELGITDQDEGIVILEKWAKKLREMPEQCIEIVGGSPHIFDFPLFSSKLILSLYSSIATSPVITQYRWSDVVLRGAERIIPSIVHSDKNQEIHPSLDPLRSTLAIHLRRGDFVEHCYNLANQGYPYNSWNLLPGFVDRYDEPNYERIYDDGTDEGRAKLNGFLEHCWPDIAKLVQRVKEITREYYQAYPENESTLTNVYILTNERDQNWLAELKDALLAIRLEEVKPSSTGQYLFKRISTSRDMTFVADTENVAKQAIDMAIAERAGLFLGNGFSTLSANVNLFRLARGLEPNTCRNL